MNTSELLEELIQAVPSEDWRRLEANDSSLVISKWNRETLLGMRGFRAVPGEVSMGRVDELRSSLSRYLERYMPDRPEGHRWIILSCLFLAFVAREPLHPRQIVGHRQVLIDGRPAFLCPAREDRAESLCRFCVCKKDEQKAGKTL